ncbi:hypothetical protein WJX74_003741 [Apatococcus lobatus]|uniref:Uncharacterized protein n=1 Tax=Apatococcus lobatus TaxID=904363 RepID=A0AAW1QTP5_9CHLO
MKRLLGASAGRDLESINAQRVHVMLDLGESKRPLLVHALRALHKLPALSLTKLMGSKGGPVAITAKMLAAGETTNHSFEAGNASALTTESRIAALQAFDENGCAASSYAAAASQEVTYVHLADSAGSQPSASNWLSTPAATAAGRAASDAVTRAAEGLVDIAAAAANRWDKQRAAPKQLQPANPKPCLNGKTCHMSATILSDAILWTADEPSARSLGGDCELPFQLEGREGAEAAAIFRGAFELVSLRIDDVLCVQIPHLAGGICSVGSEQLPALTLLSISMDVRLSSNLPGSTAMRLFRGPRRIPHVVIP